ncbi:DUF2788 domain-containing protein [Plesiomonas shigelloides subsp. oncorhynchi]|nr:DUF2788 domain-containing protein [Plesiomonas shigelloides]
METIEAIGLDLFFIVLFFFIGMAIQDVLKRGNVPPFGRRIVWLVLFLGCAGFVAKGLIQLYWEGAGIG